MNNFLITVKGVQYINDDEDIIELKTLGKFKFNNNKFYIKYSQTDDDGSVTNTLIKVGDNEVLLQRSGATESRMQIEVGKRNSCYYRSQGAGMILEVYGISIENALTLNGGSLSLEYSLSINSAPISQNKIEITVKEV